MTRQLNKKDLDLRTWVFRCCLSPGLYGRLSFPVYQESDGVITISQESVNGSTLLTAPSTLVKEISKVLPWPVQYMRDTPVGLHILFCKLDIGNGFWCLVA
jgi:hypothetical protein